MFEKLQVVERLCKILLDEIHIKPGVQYYVEHLLVHSVNDPQKTCQNSCRFDGYFFNG